MFTGIPSPLPRLKFSPVSKKETFPSSYHAAESCGFAQTLENAVAQLTNFPIDLAQETVLMKKPEPGSLLWVFVLLVLVAIIHSCLWELDIDTPADPRTTNLENVNESRNP